MSDREPVARESVNLADEQKSKLQELFPEVFSEGRVDFDKLRATLGDLVDDRPDRYNFTWAGKREAIRLLQMPTRATLVPARDESVNFDDTQHLFIEGDNLEVLKILYKSYFGRVKLIYIDPPYNTGNDFIYPDNYADPLATYLQLTGQTDSNGNLLTSNPETSGRYHSTWLSMMYPRLFIARQLLQDDGVIFVSINDKELHNLKLLMNEVFGEENFFTVIVVQSNKRGQTYKQISTTHEYLLVYTKSTDTEINELEKSGEKDDLNLEDDISRFNIRELRNRNPKYGKHNRPNLFYPFYVNPNVVDESGFSPISLGATEKYSVKVLPLNSEGGESCWRWEKKKALRNMQEHTPQSNLVAHLKNTGEYGIYEKYRKTTYKAKSIWFENDVITEKGTVELGSLGLAEYFEFPKPTYLLKKVLMLGMDETDIVLDFFAGSSTIAQAIYELNKEDGGSRHFIAIQLPEPTGKTQYPTITAVSKERIRRVITSMQADENDTTPSDNNDLGFKVFKLVESNMRLWAGVQDIDPDEYVQQMALFTNPLVDGWQVENVIYEVALREGFSLNSTITKVDLEMDNTIYRITDPDKEQRFYICLDNRINPDPTYSLGLQKTDLFICRDVALDDTLAANIALNCRLKTI